MKIKYWSATYSAGVSGSRPFLTTTGLPAFSKKEAIGFARRLNSSNAVVVRADEHQMPSLDVVWAKK